MEYAVLYMSVSQHPESKLFIPVRALPRSPACQAFAQDASPGASPLAKRFRSKLGPVACENRYMQGSSYKPEKDPSVGALVGAQVA